MNDNKTKSKKTAVNQPPLFASVWLALFSELRKSYLEQRATNPSDKETSIH